MAAGSTQDPSTLITFTCINPVNYSEWDAAMSHLLYTSKADCKNRECTDGYCIKIWETCISLQWSTCLHISNIFHIIALCLKYFLRVRSKDDKSNVHDIQHLRLWNRTDCIYRSNEYALFPLEVLPTEACYKTPQESIR